MKKILAKLVALTCACGILAGCGNKEVNIDISQLGSSLSSQITYDDELSEVDLEIANRLMDLSGINITNSAIYVGAGATAEEIVILECASEEDANIAKTKMEARISEQKEVFADYAPAEVTKLDSALVVTNGKYAIMCVSGDKDKASQIISEAVSK